MKINFSIILIFCGLQLIIQSGFASDLPANFVYLHDIDPTIVQDIRYAGDHNFIGRKIQGYNAAECVLTQAAAERLKQVQTDLKPLGLGLKVYDCYRPERAVRDFVNWSEQPEQQQMKGEFYPRVAKEDFFRLGYVAERSGHSRGSTVDLTLVKLPTQPQANYHPGDKLLSCILPAAQRFQDNSVDMGTGFDCMDILSHGKNRAIGPTAYKNRMLLQQVMRKHGFRPYAQEWWHFTLRGEPFSHKYFNFSINPDTLPASRNKNTKKDG